MKSIKSKYIFLLAAILLLASLRGCLYYDYGVDKIKTKLPYRTYYFSEKDKDYDFTTVLLSKEDLPMATNYTNFNVTINHMYKETIQTNNNGKYISRIVFGNITSNNIHINANSIRLLHKDSDNNVISHDKIEHNLSSARAGKYADYYYSKVYDANKLPKSIKEHIYFEVTINGVTTKMEYDLPIEKALHYTFWDQLMGI